MANYQIIRRFEIIMRLVNLHPYIKKEEIIQRLAEDYDIMVTARTLECDMNALATDFGIEITYDYTRRGYFLNEQDENQIAGFLQFAGRIYLGDLLREGLTHYDELKQAVVLEDYSNFEGISKIKPVLSAIEDHHLISFNHENFQKETTTKYCISPFQLREYQGRWYVVGLPEGENHIKTFGLARISDLRTAGKSSCIKSKYLKQLEKFDQIIGLNYDGSDKKEVIEILVSNSQYKYLKTLPLHASQRFEEQLTDGRTKISMSIIPNYELIMQLLKFGDQMEVIRPEKLRNKIKKIIENNLKIYQDGK